MPRDYYDVLGINRHADEQAIKKAYRRIAKQYHPDINKDPGAEEKFKEAQEAYSVLSDPQQRNLYDQFGHAGVNSQAAGPGSGQGHPFGGGRQVHVEGFDGIFEQLFSGSGSPFGRGRRPGPRRQPPRKGANIEHHVHIDFDRMAHGGALNLELAVGSKKQSIEVRIPKAIADQGKLRLRGKGQPSPNDGQSGDLIVIVHVKDHPWFKRDQLDLYVDLPVSITEACLGGRVDVPTLDKPATIRIPAGTGSGRKIRLRGKGLVNDQGDTGDLYAVIQIQVPEQLDEHQQEILQELGKSLPDARARVPWC